MNRLLLTVPLALALLLNACSGPFAKGWGDAGEVHRAAWAGDAEGIEKAIAAGEDPNRAATIPNLGFPKRDGFGYYTPLSLAIQMNKPQSVRTLVQRGATVTPTNLLRAASEGPDVTREILATGIDVSASAKVFNLTTETALHVAAKRSDIATCKVLLDAGANINARDSEGNTPLHVVAMKVYLARKESQRDNRLQMAEFLLESGADPAITNNAGKTPRQSIQYWTDLPPDDRLALLLERHVRAKLELEEVVNAPTTTQ